MKDEILSCEEEDIRKRNAGRDLGRKKSCDVSLAVGRKERDGRRKVGGIFT